jgi:hypothetical protein
MITVYTPEDLRLQSQEKDFKEITFYDLRTDMKVVQESELIVYMDGDSVRLLKHRYVGDKLKAQLKTIGIRPFNVYYEDV